MEGTFETIDHGADIGVVAYGASIEETFANAALGLFSLITNLGDIRERLNRDLAVSAEDMESLLVAWLNELIYLFDVEYTLFRRFEINHLTQTQLRARCYGEQAEPARHKLKIGVKAATYHMLRIDKDNNDYKAQVIFDV